MRMSIPITHYIGRGWMNRFKAASDTKVPDLHGIKRLSLLIDSWIEDAVLGVPVEEYFAYEFYLRNRRGRRAFAAGYRIWRLYDDLNDMSCLDMLFPKTGMWENYETVLKRDHVCAGTASFEEFLAFTVRHPRFFVKPSDKECGIGCRIMTCDSDSEAKEMYSWLHENDYVAEELVKQCTELAEFNASTPNTIRIISFVDKKGNPQLFPYGIIRLGRAGKVVDNYGGGNGGLGCPIDIQSGCIVAQGFDIARNQYTDHPDSGKRIVGFQIPAWKKVCEAAKQAALICPRLRVIGWDIAVSDSYEAIVIEGNPRPSPISYQMDGVGRWQMIHDMVSEHMNVRDRNR